MEPVKGDLPDDALTRPVRTEDPLPAENEEVALGEPPPAAPPDPGTLVIRRTTADAAGQAPDDRFAQCTPTESQTLCFRPRKPQSAAEEAPGTTGPVQPDGEVDAEPITHIIRRGQATATPPPPVPVRDPVTDDPVTLPVRRGMSPSDLIAPSPVEPAPNEFPPGYHSQPLQRNPTPPSEPVTEVPAIPPADETPDPATVVIERTRRPVAEARSVSEPEVTVSRGLPTLIPGGLKAPAAPPTGPAAAPDPSQPTCPRCGGRLIDPASLGLCHDCGYCRLLEEGAGSAWPRPRSGPKPATARRLEECVDRFLGLPAWVWVLLVGEVLAVLVSIAGQQMLHDETREYTLWYSLQAGLGLVALLTAQFWALMLVAPEDSRLGAKDLFLPARLWWVAFRKLPTTRWPVWVGTWGLTLLVGAVVVFAGPQSWSELIAPQPKPDDPAPRAELVRPSASRSLALADRAQLLDT